VSQPLGTKSLSAGILAIVACTSLFTLLWFLDARLTAAGADSGHRCYPGNGGYQDEDSSLSCTEPLTSYEQYQLYSSAGSFYGNCWDEAMAVTNGIGSYVYEWTGTHEDWDAFWALSGYIGFHYDVMDDAGLVAHEGSHYVTNSTDETTPEAKQNDCLLIPPAPRPGSHANASTPAQGEK
jgi:hypothetical protein